MSRNHPTGQIAQKPHKPGDGFTGLSLPDSLLLAGAVIEDAAHIRKSRCPWCGREFSSWELNKARSIGIVKCPGCGRNYNISELTW